MSNNSNNNNNRYHFTPPVDEAQLVTCDDDCDVNNGEHVGSDSHVVILPTEEALQEVVVSSESRHETNNVIRTTPERVTSSEEGSHTLIASTSDHTPAASSSPTPQLRSQHTGGQGVKRLRLQEQDTDDSPTTTRLRTSENNEQVCDERDLTAWSDSMIHAWDQISFTDSESEEEDELPHEIPQELFRDRDLNIRLDYDMLSRVNRYFERLFDLAGQPLSYREAEDIVASAQSDVLAILRNIIACQQQHNEALRHAAEFWRSCHDQLYNEFRQFQQSMSGVSEAINQQHAEQRLVVNALSLMGERLNLIQRMLTDLYNRMGR
ncbi:uncharacterized protein LOC107678790 [Sinocyclocheilus anshuiensis]|uniref:uncharacterized protein LOC107678790 n=1 Tax=Sinocyclocheilus anshuiensis TaxID=1608454 RepID=UPI0007B8703E|nr:PREDICTED: uncharacterized protein LOC107678790 [Sinocyclocheilus anshuiensis]